MLSDILNTFIVNAGYTLPGDRAVALSYINRAAKEVYDELEPDDGLSEVILQVPRNMQLALPYYIANLRGVREYKYSTPIPMHTIGVPQYTSNTWKFMWRNWRIKAPSPIQYNITNSAPLTLSTPLVEAPTPATVAIAMQTSEANMIVEQVVINAVSVQTVNSPVKIWSISCANQGRIYNININDVNGVNLATLYNNQNKTRYRVIDVSEYQWSSWFSNSPDITLAECLFKPVLFPFYNDTDEFISLGYDDAIAYKALSFNLFGQEGKEQDAIGFEKKCVQAMDLAQRNQEGAQDKRLMFAENPVYRAFRRAKSRGWYYNGGYGGMPYWGYGGFGDG